MEKNKEGKSGNQLVNVGIIAQLFGMTERRVQQLTQEGVIGAVRVGRYNKYDLLQTIKRYIAHLQTKATEKDGNRDRETELRTMEADASLKESKAGMAALELKDLESKMLRSEDVEAMTADLLLTIEQQLNNLPGKLKGIHELTDAAEISHRIQEEAHAILWTLANYRYDPDEYEKKKATRRGGAAK